MDRLARPLALGGDGFGDRNKCSSSHSQHIRHSLAAWVAGCMAGWLAQIPPRLRFPIPSQQLQPAQTKCPSFLPASLPPSLALNSERSS